MRKAPGMRSDTIRIEQARRISSADLRCVDHCGFLGDACMNDDICMRTHMWALCDCVRSGNEELGTVMNGQPSARLNKDTRRESYRDQYSRIARCIVAITAVERCCNIVRGNNIRATCDAETRSSLMKTWPR